MTTKQIYELAVQMGIKADLRGQAKVKKYLSRIKAKYEKMDKAAKAEFDPEKLWNPYSDTRLLVDNGRKEIKKLMAGIDIGGSELILAEKMGFDLVISHHPKGKALADLHSVMDLQAEVLADYGVPINIAESVLRPRISEVSRSVSPVNHNRTVDIARLLGLDYICTHTIADNLGASFLVQTVKKQKPETVGDVVELLKKIPEFREAAKLNAGPALFTGHADNQCGKIVISEFTGGTSGAKEIYEKMAHAGIGTIIGMHMGEEHRKEAEKFHINVVIAGHMASDSLGMNLFLDALERKGIKILSLSGLIRAKRGK
ncbi:MAG: NGG1p interacting factor NIF3 [Planctomycetes bacterium]|jgi:putative NIF3 family GTP cyclohydrolase 1 type 2|nr:NGG1p interacting factor NIF3 [Planctomycetota bacterium]